MQLRGLARIAAAAVVVLCVTTSCGEAEAPAAEEPIGELAVAAGGRAGASADDARPPLRRDVEVTDCSSFRATSSPVPYVLADAPLALGRPICFLGVPEGQQRGAPFDTVGTVYVPTGMSDDDTLFEILDAGGLLVELDPLTPDQADRARPATTVTDAAGRRYAAEVDVHGHEAVVNRPKADRYGVSWVEDGPVLVAVLGNHSGDELLRLARRLQKVQPEGE